MTLRYPLLLLLLAPLALPAQATATLTGLIRSDGAPLVGAQILSDAAERTALSGPDGRFRLANLPIGPRQLTIRALGHTPVRVTVTLTAEGMAPLTIDLERTASVLQTIVTTGTLRETWVEDSPVKVEVVSPAFLRRNSTTNLMDNLSFLPGLNQQVDCGVCFTNNIRINGMEGPYTAVLLDGTPMMSALATVYGLNSIDPALVQQVEIIKGPNSTLYGSEAMGGVINIVTRDSRFGPTLSASVTGSSHGEQSAALGATRRWGNTSTLLSLNASHNARFVDHNGDDFSDLPLVSRLSVFNRWRVGVPGQSTGTLSLRYYDEDRFGGTSRWRRSDRGSSTIYGESIRTRRVEALGGWQGGADGDRRLDLAFNHHDQDSWYGDSPYQARQSTAFVQGRLAPRVGAHQLGIGASLRIQDYRDSTSHQRTHDTRVAPGIFAQDEVALHADWTSLVGLRLDHHSDHGLVASPRVALMWRPDAHTTVRASAATGFRVVNLFTEDHAALTGAREVVLAETLQPERSTTTTLSLARTLDIGGVHEAMTLDLDLYHTRFRNRILPDYDQSPGQIVYQNLDGHATTRGISLAAGYATLRSPFMANLGLTLQETTLVDAGTRSAIPFAPTFQGVFTIGYRVDALRSTFDWTGRVLGPMTLPTFAGLPDRSPWWTEQHLQVRTAVAPAITLELAVKNLFNEVQSNPIVDPANPFGDAFDTARVYGPLQGRRLQLGFRYLPTP